MRHSVSLMIAAGAIAATAFVSTAHAVPVHAFWSFDTLQNGTGAVNSAVTAETFPGTPSRVRTGSSTGSDGGELSFTDFQGNTWLGSGGFVTPGHSLAWNAGSTGNTMTHNFDMTSLADLKIRMAIRSATNGPAPITAFSAIDFNTGSGFTTAASGADLIIPVSGNNFVEYTLDLSSLNAIENKANIALRFSFGTIPANTSFRVDNIQFTAQVIPEPATLALGLLSAAGLLVRRRRAL